MTWVNTLGHNHFNADPDPFRNVHQIGQTSISYQNSWTSKGCVSHLKSRPGQIFRREIARPAWTGQTGVKHLKETGKIYGPDAPSFIVAHVTDAQLSYERIEL